MKDKIKPFFCRIGQHHFIGSEHKSAKYRFERWKKGVWVQDLRLMYCDRCGHIEFVLAYGEWEE